jgi:hypothetical protein
VIGAMAKCERVRVWLEQLRKKCVVASELSGVAVSLCDVTGKEKGEGGKVTDYSLRIKTVPSSPF